MTHSHGDTETAAREALTMTEVEAILDGLSRNAVSSAARDAYAVARKLVQGTLRSASPGEVTVTEAVVEAACVVLHPGLWNSRAAKAARAWPDLEAEKSRCRTQALAALTAALATRT